jgi:hypothetical protein
LLGHGPMSRVASAEIMRIISVGVVSVLPMRLARVSV